MKGYLHVRAGRLGLLLPVAGVLEVLEVARASVSAGHAPWRDSSLPVVEGRALLGEAPAAAVGVNAAVIYAPAAEALPSMILVDRVAGLVPAANVVALRRAPAIAARLFEATAEGEGGERLYCLRRPLAELCNLPVASDIGSGPEQVADSGKRGETRTQRKNRKKAGGAERGGKTADKTAGKAPAKRGAANRQTPP